MRVLALALVACLACATRAVPPPGPGPANATPISALTHGAALLERGEHRRFLDELVLPSELAQTHHDGSYERLVAKLESGDARWLAATFRRASASSPSPRSDGALVFDGHDRSQPAGPRNDQVTLIARDGRWYVTFERPRVPPPPPPLMLIVRIPRAEIPAVRGEGYDRIIDDFMQARGAGKVTGTGGSLDRPPFVGIDVEVADVARALPLLRTKLRELRAPKGTVIIEGRGRLGGVILLEGQGQTTTHAVW